MVKRTKLIIVSMIVAVLLALSSAVALDCWGALGVEESAAPAVMEMAGRFSGGGST